MEKTFSDILISIKKNLISTANSSSNSYSELQQKFKTTINQNMEIMDNVIDIAVKYEDHIKKLEEKNEKLEEIILTKIINLLEK